MKSMLYALTLAVLLQPVAAHAEDGFLVTPTEVTDWKAVYGRVEAKDNIPARARLGGTLVELVVSEGDVVQAGQPMGRIVDEKLDFQLGAIDAQLQALEAQLANAEAELTRGEELLSRGVTTAQRLDALRTQVDVVKGQIEAQKAQAQVVRQQADEGTVLAPISGRVLNVPVAMGAVVMPGEVVATVGGGGFFLRLAVPERHAANLTEGDTIRVEAAAGVTEGRLAKVYPLIENGRVIADVEVAALDVDFVDARVLVRLPMGKRQVLLVPADMVVTHAGLDFVQVDGLARVVVPGIVQTVDGVKMVEIVTGLQGGETVTVNGQ
ncbi:efflux RND transporter periplasmic adaptor subunit [Phaeovulum sp.]|uniref:efflux RND transporter periplasmic adaptor subunit n=1 Tax=Phaeovulum sp. TaxID=2934796 RepID=UPI0039E3DDE7